MGLDKFNHVIKENDEQKYRVVEDGITKERAEFLKELLEFNGYETVIEEVPPKNEEDPVTWTIGTTDILFNPIVKVYNRELKTPNGHKVTADYWNQLTSQSEPNYWDRSKKDWLGNLNAFASRRQN